MKKLVLMFVAMAAISFASCDNKGQKVENNADSTEVADTAAQDTAAQDTAKVDTAVVK